MAYAYPDAGLDRAWGDVVQVSLFRWVVFALGISSLSSAPAWAQRSDDNAVASADDAFGTTVGNETIGLYDARNARGFQPQQSGNVRIEGMYFDRPSSGMGDVFIDRLYSGFTVRVGINSLTFPFPAPSAVVDIRLRKPLDKQVTSFVATYGPYDTTGLEGDFATPVVAGKLSVGGGFEHARFVADGGQDADDHSFGGIARFTPTEEIEVLSFFGQSQRKAFELFPFTYVAGDNLPPEQERGVNNSQPWAQQQQTDTNYGAIATAKVSPDWTLRAAIFRATYDRTKEHTTFYNNTQADGAADLVFQRGPRSLVESTSGEVQAQGVFTEGPRRHTLYAMVRGRDGSRQFGGTSQIAYGPANINNFVKVSEPPFVLGVQGRDGVKQITGGAQYVGQWRNLGDINLGVQKTNYERVLTHPINPTQTRKLSPWLYNGSVSYRPTQTLTLYTAYTKGVEDSGTTPQSARNRGEAVPATVTKQIDVGFMYVFRPGLRMNGALFQITKPFYDKDATNLYTDVGDWRQRGAELSFTGQLMPGLNIVAGAVVYQPRVIGPLVDQGVVGSVPMGRDESAARLDLQYGPASWMGVSVEGQLEYTDRGYGNTLNRADVPARLVLNLGMRYRFQAFGASGQFRARVQNVTNVYSWDFQGGNNLSFQYMPQRRATFTLAADF